jgi:hypothetical protein
MQWKGQKSGQMYVVFHLLLFSKSLSGWVQLPRTLDLTRDYFRFVLKFFGIISTSAPHVYISALPLSPQTSIVRKLYEQYACPLTRVVQGLPISWDPIPATRYDAHFWGSAAWSPCNRFIAVVKSGVIEILDAATLERRNVFRSPKGVPYRPLCFSPDGCTLTQFCKKGINSWDIQTGGPGGSVDVDFVDFLSSAYSMDGRILAVLGSSWLDFTLVFTIVTFDLLSWTHTRSYHAPEGRIVPPIWTHRDCLRFATVKPGSIDIWEAEFTSVHTPAIIGSFATPDDIADAERGQCLFLPALSQLAFAAQDTISIWDILDSRFSLNHSQIPVSAGLKMSFSSDGRFFSTSAGRNIYVWKKSPSRYVLHQMVTLPSLYVVAVLSPDGETIIAVGGQTIYVWHTRNQIHFLPGASAYESGRSHTLDFSSENVLSASVRHPGTTVTIRDLQSGDLWLDIDASMEIMCLRVTRSAVAVAGEGRVIIWNIPEEHCVGARASVEDSAHTATLDLSDLQLYGPREKSISPDLSRIAVLTHTPELLTQCLQIHDTSTGSRLADVEPFPQACLHIDLGEHEVWGDFGHVMEGWEGIEDRESKNVMEGWEVIEDRESGSTKLKPLSGDMSPQKLRPWNSRCGYKVTQDGWVLSPTEKRLLWLPHHWRSDDVRRIWSGRFLGLKQEGLPEAVILEFFE